MSDDLALQAQARALAPYLRTWVFTPFYEEGTYTPTYEGGTTPGATTYSVQAGFYRRYGKLVFVWGSVVWTAASGTGNAQVSLPFTSLSTANSNVACAVRTQNVTFANGSIQGQVSANTNFIVMHSPATNAGGTNVAVEAAGTIIFMAIYPIVPT